jgi:hypothetical protein
VLRFFIRIILDLIFIELNKADKVKIKNKPRLKYALCPSPSVNKEDAMK